MEEFIREILNSSHCNLSEAQEEAVIEAFSHIQMPGKCANCTNNPKNGGSGICHCILGTETIW